MLNRRGFLRRATASLGLVGVGVAGFTPPMAAPGSPERVSTQVEADALNSGTLFTVNDNNAVESAREAFQHLAEEASKAFDDMRLASEKLKRDMAAMSIQAEHDEATIRLLREPFRLGSFSHQTPYYTISHGSTSDATCDPWGNR